MNQYRSKISPHCNVPNVAAQQNHSNRVMAHVDFFMENTTEIKGNSEYVLMLKRNDVLQVERT